MWLHFLRSGPVRLFREVFYDCLPARADAQFELTEALLCVNAGSIEIARLRRGLAGLPLPRIGERIVLAADVSPWLRPDAQTSPQRLFCHVHGRAKGTAQMIPGWPYSVVAALGSGRSSWTAVLDAVRVGSADDTTAVTAAQLREVVDRLRQNRPAFAAPCSGPIPPNASGSSRSATISPPASPKHSARAASATSKDSRSASMVPTTNSPRSRTTRTGSRRPRHPRPHATILSGQQPRSGRLEIKFSECATSPSPHSRLASIAAAMHDHARNPDKPVTT